MIISILLSIFFVSGFYLLGKKIIKITKSQKIVEAVSDSHFQYPCLGIVFFLFVLYPIFFFEIYNKLFFVVTSSILLILGIFNILLNFRSIKNFLKNILSINRKISLVGFLVSILVSLYFLITISPITSGDSVSYHMGSAKYIFENGIFSKYVFSSEYPIVGAGEFLNTFAFSVSAFQFTSIINFLGLVSILGIIKKFCFYSRVSYYNKNVLFLFILSCPVLVFLTSTSKSQLFSTSLIFFSYALLIYCLNYTKNKNFIMKSFFILMIMSIVAIQNKISFSLSFFIIITTFFFYFIKKIDFKTFIFIFILFFVVGLLPQVIWKQYVYGYPFYKFLINPFPLNIPGYNEVYLGAKNYFQEKFPFILFIPLNLSDLTQFIGVGMFSLFFLFKSNYKNKKILLFIIIFFFIVYSILGQKASRFYLEIYLFIILILTLIFKKLKSKKMFSFLKNAIILQSIFTICILSIGVFNLLPGSFSDKLNKKILSQYASGYNLYTWANEVLPKNSITMISHRSYYFAEKKMIYVGMANYFKNETKNGKEFFLKQIKEEKPNYILFYGDNESFNYSEFNFKDCTKGLFKKKLDVGFHERRNFLSIKKNYYNGYIYHLEASLMPGCVKFN
jgi:hypothetical protein